MRDGLSGEGVPLPPGTQEMTSGFLTRGNPGSFRSSWFPSRRWAPLRRSPPPVPRILPYISPTLHTNLPLLSNLPPGFGILGKQVGEGGGWCR